jgi:hypothetical protein
MFLSKDRKIDSDKLAALVNETYELVMKKIDRLESFYLSFAGVLSRQLQK